LIKCAEALLIHVYVIRHDPCHVQYIILSVVVAATKKHDVSRARGQDPTEFGDERDEVRREVLLEMGQITPIELHE
jgi:hypothetical protein